MEVPMLWLMTLAVANEGYWQPEQVAEMAPQLEALGIEIPSETVASLDEGPLASVVRIGGCSGAFVSPDGLIATAYHCVGRGLRLASEQNENLFRDGFYAPTKDEERATGGTLTVKLTTSNKDVTSQVLAGTRRLTGEARTRRIKSNIRNLVARCEGKEGIRCEVSELDNVVSYRLITQRELTDIRLVYAPPYKVGYFGGDEDNWRWPRHSGDFAFVRAWADDAPYRPDAHLPVALGPQPGTGVIVAGYPAGTYRWLSAAELEYAAEERYPRTIETGKEILQILEHWVEADPDLSGKLGPKMLTVNNRVQYLEGNLDAFKRMKAIEQKWAFENAVAQWILEEDQRRQQYGDVVNQMHRLTIEEGAQADLDHLVDRMKRHVVMLDTALTLYRMARETQKPDSQRAEGFQSRDRSNIARRMENIDAAYDWRVDRDLLRALLIRMHALPTGLHIPELDRWFAALPTGDSFEERLDKQLVQLYANSTELGEQDTRRRFMETGPTYLERANLPFIDLAAALIPYLERRERVEDEREAQWAEVRPRYLQAVQQYLAEHKGPVPQFYPDANRTLRVSLGRVEGYAPTDGLVAEPRTRLAGLGSRIAEPPFDAPQTLIDAIETGQRGPYLDEALGDVPVAFLSTADTTLGNSGSPTIDASGAWVGVLFDGNYESMATDWIWDEAVTRSIHTDSSYVLWYLDAVAGADSLLAELGFEPAIGAESADATEE